MGLLAAACDARPNAPTAPDAPLPLAPADASPRPIIALDPPAMEHASRDADLPAGGGAAAGVAEQGAQAAHVRLGEEFTLPPGAELGPDAPLVEPPGPQETAAAPAAEAALTGPRRIGAASPPPVTARQVAIVDEASGALLYGQDERARVAPASLTKIATALVALERAPDLSRRVVATISGSAMAARDGSSIMGLEPGREVSLTTLLYGLMLPSGNDAAEQIALVLGGTRKQYVAWMNEKVAELGLQDTHFVNPSGMDAAGHYASAYDMALLARAAMQDETFRQLAGAARYRGDGYTLANLNRLIGSYPGADGVKIGRTRAAGRTIVASASRDGHRVYVSLMRSQDLPGDSSRLFDWVWRTFEW
jgi:D-alanyl-D-alanine carboxypeptidase (penicillin-binding protein 5/6)